MILRADAGVTQGTGHVMRLLTLAEALLAAEHDVVLATAALDVPWLIAAVERSSVEVVAADRDRIDADALAAFRPDWVVVDSYVIPAWQISRVAERLPLLMVADGDIRGARARLYLDQNLGADAHPLRGADPAHQLLGARYALVRDDFTARVPPTPEAIRHRPPRVVVVLGGTDPGNHAVAVARACLPLLHRAAFTFVAQPRQRAALGEMGRGSANWSVTGPTTHLPEILAGADVVVSAAGTSAWDVCTLGIPSLLLAVVDNQRASLAAAVQGGLALGVDLLAGPVEKTFLTDALSALLSDGGLRTRLTAACRRTFDGRGPSRVVAAMSEHSGRAGAVGA